MDGSCVRGLPRPRSEYPQPQSSWLVLESKFRLDGELECARVYRCVCARVRVRMGVRERELWALRVVFVCVGRCVCACVRVCACISNRTCVCACVCERVSNRTCVRVCVSRIRARACVRTSHTPLIPS